MAINREMMFVDHGYEIMDEIAAELTEIGKLERKAQMLGRRMNMIVVPALYLRFGRPLKGAA